MGAALEAMDQAWVVCMAVGGKAWEADTGLGLLIRMA